MWQFRSDIMPCMRSTRENRFQQRDNPIFIPRADFQDLSWKPVHEKRANQVSRAKSADNMLSDRFWPDLDGRDSSISSRESADGGLSRDNPGLSHDISQGSSRVDSQQERYRRIPSRKYRHLEMLNCFCPLQKAE